MVKKKNNDDVLLPQSFTSRTITRSGIINDGKELVVSCGYAVSGAFGYFMCWEKQTPRIENKVLYEYSDVVRFKQKVNDRTLQDLLKEFQIYVDSHRNNQFTSN
jgi:hypothetical protein